MDIQRPQRAAPADLAAFHRLQHQITRQRHVQRRQRDRHLIFLAPLYAAFAQHDQRAENRILLYRDAQLWAPARLAMLCTNRPWMRARG